MISMRYDSIEGALFAIVMHSASGYGDRAARPPVPGSAQSAEGEDDERALLRVDVRTGAVGRVGLAARRALVATSSVSDGAGGGMMVCAEASESDFRRNTSVAQLACPAGLVISSVDFASYGTPAGKCGAYKQSAVCHAAASLLVARHACLTLARCALRADVATWSNDTVVGGDGANATDPCPALLKWLYLQVRCSQPKAGMEAGDVFSLRGQHASVGVAALDPAENLYYTVVHPVSKPYDTRLLAVHTTTGVVRWAAKMQHQMVSMELNRRHKSLVDALQPPFAFPHYRGIGAQRPPVLAPHLKRARLLGVGGEGTLGGHRMVFLDPSQPDAPLVHHAHLFDRAVNATLHKQEALRMAALAEELAFNQTFGWAMARPATHPFASRSARCALLTPQVNPGSCYRRGKST